MSTKLLFKDEVLDDLAKDTNVAQFISYGPDLKQRYSRIYGMKPNIQFSDIRDAIEALFKTSAYKKLNIRTYYPDSHQSQPFVYGLTEMKDVLYNLITLSEKGLFIILHETIDVNDGGVSGVIHSGVMEFSPGVTVRFVEQSTDPISVFTKEFGCKLIKTVYGFSPSLNYADDMRIEFSIHPTRVGYHKLRTIIWQSQKIDKCDIESYHIWPSAFSKLIGDKVYGLLIADLLGFRVPHTNVFPRNSIVGNFSFGKSTGSSDVWMRTCPAESIPGKFITIRGWHNPFTLMDDDDPSGKNIVSCLSQREVVAKYSGICLSTNENVVIEGVYGFGDNFMLGADQPVRLPNGIIQNIKIIYDRISKILGPVRFEWVHDDKYLWIVQLHLGKVVSSGRTIVPGDHCSHDIIFETSQSLEKLRELISVVGNDTRIIVRGNIGMGSHIADVLRKANIPSILETIE